MLQLPFLWIDAFTDKMLGGNPCAVVLNADSLSVSQMQAIANEINLSETAFVMNSDKADFAARYFTPSEELPFAGHPTLSSIHALISENIIKLNKPITNVTLEVPAGIIPIEIHTNSDETFIVMSQLTPKFLKIYNPNNILPVFGLTSNDLLPGAVIQTVSTGTPILMIPLKNHECLKRIQYKDIEAYYQIKAAGDFSFPHHFVLGGATTKGQTFARSLGTPPSGLEDPFTGSATGCMAAFLWKYGLISENKFVAEQGHWMNRPGEADIEIIGPPSSIQTIRVKGKAKTLIRGNISL